MLVSVVVILERTLRFQASLVAVVSVSRVVPAGIWALTFEQACSVELKDTPTLEVTLAFEKVYKTPRREVDVTLSPAGYSTSSAFVLPDPTKVAYDSGAGSK